ncbi:hypothetical protein [Microbulbifer sp. VAAF005]|uniref:zinc-ribbon domain-containing protein n=1 Tax=Microbulbifer sp. VAAF005 TaxID=3034230 RepID=UPI0024AE1C1D|nr:hypothetical protein [Microbulbifer sp. VAAF005]WHI46560.1 hypothetical protein P0078_23115 [Microbulbifer sp. VAAF005]
MIFECEDCGTERDLDVGELPDNSSDDDEIECRNCGAVFIAGWVAEIEIRGRVSE